ncbi:unnamed protein product [Dibothriocephalus latus]|uniref:Uncharacterized protein n=1 Tax=Dibothriocephalus latus TaxID=60516 RepID=A0A3P7LAL1_DIBLA|nr:unnamed protein product [Dibothriocephalus latus]
MHASSSPGISDESSSAINVPPKIENLSSVEVKRLSQVTFPEVSARFPVSHSDLSNSLPLVPSQRIEQICSSSEPPVTTECTKITNLSLSQSSDSKSEGGVKERTDDVTEILPAPLGPPSMNPDKCSRTEIISLSPAVEALAPSTFSLPADNPLSGVVGGVSTELEQKAVSIPPNQETTDTPQLSLVLPASTSEMCNCSPRPESAQEEFHSLAAEPSSFSSFDWTNLTPANNSRAEHFSSAAQSANDDRAIATGLSRITFPAESGSISKVAAVSTSDSAVYRSPPNHLSPCDFSTDCQCVQSPNSPGFPTGEVCEPPEETTPFGQSRMINLLPGSSSAGVTTGMDAASEPHIRISSAVVTTPRTGGRSISGDDLSVTYTDTQEAPPPASLPSVTGDEVGVELPVKEEPLVPIEFPASDQGGDGVHAREDARVGEGKTLLFADICCHNTDLF